MRLLGRIFRTLFGVAGALIATALAVVSWVLYAIPAPSHPERLISPIAVTVCAVLLGGAVVKQSILDRNQRPAFRDHVRELQSFAQGAIDSVERGQGGFRYTVPVPIGMGHPLGRAFGKHFPALAARIDEWNQVTTGYQEVFGKFQQEMVAEKDRLPLGESGSFASSFGSLLQSIATGQIALSNLTWGVQNGQIWATSDAGGWGVAILPATEAETVRLLEQVWDSAIRVGSLPSVQEWLRRFNRREQLWPLLSDGLQAAVITQDPDGRCDWCPQ